MPFRLHLTSDGAPSSPADDVDLLGGGALLVHVHDLRGCELCMYKNRSAQDVVT
jgi:hypothetical protein